MDSEAFLKRSPQEELRRANDAARILDDPIFKEAIKTIEDSLAERRRAVPLNAPEMHTKLIMTEQLLSGLVDALKSILITGKFAMRQLEQEEAVKQRFKLFSFRS